MAEWQNGGTAEWQNGRMAEQQNGRMAEWQNGRTAERQNGRLAEQQNGRMAMEWPVIWLGVTRPSRPRLHIVCGLRPLAITGRDAEAVSVSSWVWQRDFIGGIA